jgi:hypothetical protein
MLCAYICLPIYSLRSILIMAILSQPLYDPADVPFRSFRALSKKLVNAMLPDSEVKTKNLSEALDDDAHGFSLCQHLG